MKPKPPPVNLCMTCTRDCKQAPGVRVIYCPAYIPVTTRDKDTPQKRSDVP